MYKPLSIIVCYTYGYVCFSAFVWGERDGHVLVPAHQILLRQTPRFTHGTILRLRSKHESLLLQSLTHVVYIVEWFQFDQVYTSNNLVSFRTRSLVWYFKFHFWFTRVLHSSFLEGSDLALYTDLNPSWDFVTLLLRQVQHLLWVALGDILAKSCLSCHPSIVRLPVSVKTAWVKQMMHHNPISAARASGLRLTFIS